MGFLDRLIGQSSPEQQFWQWFEKNLERLGKVENGHEPICDELHDRMQRVHKGLTFTFGKMTPREFIVSADGIRSRFPAVEKLVSAAPEVPGWKIIAFRPPSETVPEGLRLPDGKLSSDDIWFAAESAGDKVSLALFIGGYTEENHKTMEMGTFILLDHFLGEYVVETELAGIEMLALPLDPAEQGLKPFAELRNEMQRLTSV